MHSSPLKIRTMDLLTPKMRIVPSKISIGIGSNLGDSQTTFHSAPGGKESSSAQGSTISRTGSVPLFRRFSVTHLSRMITLVLSCKSFHSVLHQPVTCHALTLPRTAPCRLEQASVAQHRSTSDCCLSYFLPTATESFSKSSLRRISSPDVISRM